MATEMERKLRAALEAGKSVELQRLCGEVGSNIELEVGGFDKGIFGTEERKMPLAHHVACKPVRLLCLELLISRFGTDCLTYRNESRFGETPVHLAAQHQDESWMELVKKKGGWNCLRIVDRKGQTVAHFAAMNRKSSSCLKWLVKELGSDCFTVPDEYGDTAVHLAAKHQPVDSLRFVFDRIGAEMFSLKNERGETPADVFESDRCSTDRPAKWAWISSTQRRLEASRPPAGSSAPTAASAGRKFFTDHADDEIVSDDELYLTFGDFGGARRVETARHQLSRLKGDFYPVTDPQGYCLIINISKYDSGSHITFSHTERKGSIRDVERVKQVFESLRFIVKVKEDLTAEQVDSFLCEIKKSPDLAKHGSFVCFLMAHGTHDCIYGRDGVPCEIRMLTDRFLTSVCSGLQGKPKVFFVQACRGSRRGRTVAPNSREETDEAPAPVYNTAVRPAEGDFLLCYATTPGSAAFRNIDTGSLYVQTVCDFIEKNFRELDLSTIMTKVSGHLQRNPVRVENNLYHVVPQKVDQLSRKVSFDPERAEKV